MHKVFPLQYNIDETRAVDLVVSFVLYSSHIISKVLLNSSIISRRFISDSFNHTLNDFSIFSNCCRLKWMG
jgi:hypothetical protein